MSYCDDCGLSSCYARGGFCETSRRNIRAVVRKLKRTISVRVQWQSAGWKHVTLGHQYNYPEKGDWIEVVW